MSALAAAVGLSVLSAACYAAAAVLQERIAARAAAATGPARSAGPAVAALLSRGSGWTAVALNVLGAALHVVALRYGPLILVQPLGALTVVLAVPLGAAAAGRSTGPAEWRGVALTLLGLAGLVLATSPATAAGALDPGEVLLLAAVTTAAVVALTAVPDVSGRRSSGTGGLRYAAAAGIVFGACSALAQSVSVELASRGTDSWSTPGVLAPALLLVPLPVCGLLLSHLAYRDGLNAPLATVTLANPAAAAVIGLVLLGERFRGGAAGLLLAAVAAAVAGRGVVLLTRTRLPRQARTGQRPWRRYGIRRDGARARPPRRHPALPGPRRGPVPTDSAHSADPTVPAGADRRRRCPRKDPAA